MFFAHENNIVALGSFLKKASVLNTENEKQEFRLGVILKVVDRIYKNPTEWDERCAFNIKHIGDQFLRWLSRFEVTDDDVNHVYVMAYRFLREFDFLIGEGQELNMEMRSIMDGVEEDISDAEGVIRSQLLYASYMMPASIAKDFINDSNIGVFRDFSRVKVEAEDLRLQWGKELEAKKEDVEKLKEKLDEYKVAFNFVGLHQGFLELSEKKKREGYWLFLSLLILGFFILVPLLFELFVVLFRGVETFDFQHLLVFVPLLSIEVVLIYFFRVVLFNHRSVKAQVMQIELRMTLCQFIQSYADYSAKIKATDSVVLEKFESLIFSGILSDPEKLPSTFDGVSQIGNLIKSIKSV